MFSIVRPSQADVDVLAPAKSVSVLRDGKSLPAESVKDALTKAQPGDVITLGPGTHAGPLLVKTPNVTLVGEPGARVSAHSTTWKPAWQRAPQYGPFAWTTPIPFRPGTMSIDQRTMIDATENRGGLSVHADGSGRNGRAALGGVFTYVTSTKQLILSFATDLNPADHLIEATPAGASAITVDGADNVTIRNLIITGGRAGVNLTNTRSSVVQNCLIYSADMGVRIGQNAHACRVLSNDITWNQDSLHADADSNTADVGNDIWHTHKGYGTYDKWGVLIEEAGDNNEVAYNYVYNVWNGIENGDGVSKAEVEEHYKTKVLQGIAQFNAGLKVHHNRVDLTLDDALEPGGELVRNEWHDNVVTRTRCATRFKTISTGPFFYYNNVLLQCSDGLRLYKTMPAQATVYIFNNVVFDESAVIYHNMNSVAWDDTWLKKTLPKGTPGFHIFNNLFVANQHFRNASDEAGQQVLPNYKGDFNLFTCASDPNVLSQKIDEHSLFNAKPEFVDAAKGDFRLKPGSPGKEAGKDVRELSLNVALPKPFAERSSSRVDVGLLESTEPKAPNGPVSGLWTLAEKQLNLGERDVTQYSLVPQRWISGSNTFTLTDLPATGELLLTFSRVGSTPKFKLEFSDESGKVILTRDAKPEDRDGFSLAVPMTGAKQLAMKLTDEKSAQWRIDPGSATLSVNASNGVRLNKYDGGAYAFIYPVGDAVKSIQVSGQSKYPAMDILLVRPDGSSEKVSAPEINTAGKPGNYRILVAFTKSADLKVEGGTSGLIFDKQAESISLRPMWGKPKF